MIDAVLWCGKLRPASRGRAALFPNLQKNAAPHFSWRHRKMPCWMERRATPHFCWRYREMPSRIFPDAIEKCRTVADATEKCRAALLLTLNKNVAPCGAAGCAATISFRLKNLILVSILRRFAKGHCAIVFIGLFS